MGTSADKIAVSTSADVADFRKAVKNKDKKDGEAAVLTLFESSQLLVYKNKIAFDTRNATVEEGKQEPLEEDSFIAGLGTTEEEALIVVVPPSRLGGISIM
jgi:hypothetical protein